MWTADYFYARTTAMMVGVAVLLTFTLSSGQTTTYKASRSLYGDGRPNLDGIWQAVNTAYWNIQDHPAQPAPIVAMGAWGAIPGGLGVVDGNEIPYRSDAYLEHTIGSPPAGQAAPDVQRRNLSKPLTT